MFDLRKVSFVVTEAGDFFRFLHDSTICYRTICGWFICHPTSQPFEFETESRQLTSLEEFELRDRPVEIFDLDLEARVKTGRPVKLTKRELLKPQGRTVYGESKATSARADPAA